MTAGYRRVMVVGALSGAAVAAWVRWHGPASQHVACSPGFFVVGARCCPGPGGNAGACLAAMTCPPPLVLRGVSCDAPELRVRIPETTLEVGPSDWEAEERVSAHTIHVAPFEIDAFETTVGRMSPNRGVADSARAASGVTRSEAARYCESHGGRLPTDDEWTVAAAGASPGRRYPWGDTGAVCRRAAWGLSAGPCSNEATGPDTVGSHAGGDTPTGLHDLAGNVAEWVAPSPGTSTHTGVARGGSWQSSLATDLRTWQRLELDPEMADPRVGFRCAYDVR
jgi:formylglycine-generating enzyme